MTRILVVDDSELVLALVDYKLSEAGYRIDTATDGSLALERIAAFRPDLVLLDTMMPVMGGIEVLRTLRGDRSTRRLPVIMMSARRHPGDIAAALGAGADDYVTKPFAPAELIARIATVLRTRHLQCV